MGFGFAAIRAGIAVVAIVGCVPERTPTPPVVAATARAGLDVTMDPAVHGILEDDARRHDPPPAASRRRVYAVGDPWYSWSPSPFWSAGDQADDRVSLRGWPAPLPGQRFVLFDREGRHGVLEATSERCPPGQDDCIVCADDDPRKVHWARVVEAPNGIPRFADAFGPFAADEALPTPRRMEAAPTVRRGRWQTEDEADLDGDGVVDRRRARADCHEGQRCGVYEEWLLHDGRWYREPAAPPGPGAPMHLLEAHVWPWIDGTRRWWNFAETVEVLGGQTKTVESTAGGIVVFESFIDAEPPRTGDYWLISRRGVLATLRVAPAHRKKWCSFHGPTCHEASFVGAAIRPPKDWALLAGPVPEGLAVRRVTMPRGFPAFTYNDPGRMTPMLSLEFSDGRTWTVTQRACTRIGHDGRQSARCMISEQTLPDGGTHWHVVASYHEMHWSSEAVCSAMPEPPAGRSR